MRGLNDYRYAVFDCDGVVLQSNDIKTKAFREALRGEAPCLIDAFIEYHRSHGGISRYVKFQHFYQRMKQDSAYQEHANTAVARYAQDVRNALVHAPLVPGAIEMLKWFQEWKVPCFIVSGGDQEELREIFRERGLSRYFSEILGSPTSKSEHVKRLQDDLRIASPAVYFGDAFADMETACRYGLDFYLIHGYSEWDQGLDHARQQALPYFHDFTELMSAVLQQK